MPKAYKPGDKAVRLDLSPEQHESLNMLAGLDGVSMATLARQAVAELLEARSADVAMVRERRTRRAKAPAKKPN